VKDIRRVLLELARAYPRELVDEQLADIPRIAFHIELVQSRMRAPGAVCDIGGGVGLFSLGCAALGMRSILVDDFADPIGGYPAERLTDLHRRHGVEVVRQDALAGLRMPPSSLAAVTSFHAIEHWHHSPRRLFDDTMTALMPGGLFLLCAPNAVNLRKRVTLPLGRSNWSAFPEWYDAERFRGHVREPSVADLQTIGERLELVDARIFGRNWLGLTSRHPTVRFAAHCADRALRLRPSLCSDIYLTGYRRADMAVA
jgi:SAM-dependent methyltransferase